MICGVDVKRDESPYDLVKTLAQKNSLDRRDDDDESSSVSDDDDDDDVSPDISVSHVDGDDSVDVSSSLTVTDSVDASASHIESQLDSLSLDGDVDGDVSVDDGAMARATDWLRGAEQRHAEGAEAEAPHVELAIESE